VAGGPGETLEVARQGPGVRQQVVTEENGLRPLEVGVTGDQGPAIARNAVEQDPDELAQGLLDFGQPPFEPQAYVGGDLIVARSRGVQPPPGITHQLDEARLHRHVDVLVFRSGLPGASGQFFPDLLEPARERLAVLGRDDPGLGEHRGVGQGGLEVLIGDLEVEFERRGEVVEQPIDLRAEAFSQPAHSPSSIRRPARVRSRNALRRIKLVASDWS